MCSTFLYSVLRFGLFRVHNSLRPFFTQASARAPHIWERSTKVGFPNRRLQHGPHGESVESHALAESAPAPVFVVKTEHL